MSGPNWMNLWDKLRHAVKDGAKWVGDRLETPNQVTVSGVREWTSGDFQLSKPSNLHSTVSGTYATSSLAQRYGADNIKFYEVEGSNQLNEVSNRRISVIVRKYNDGSIGLLFQDNQSGLIVFPANLNLNSNITGYIPKNNGEFVIRNGGPTSPDDPLFGSETIDQALDIFTSSSSLNTPPEPPQPSPADTKTYSKATDLKIRFRQMVGSTSTDYNGTVTIKQVKKNGYYVINFYDNKDDKLGISDTNTGRQIWRSLWSGFDGGYKIPDSYLQSGDVDALGWLNRSFGQASPDPSPSPAPVPVSIFQTNTNEYKILFKDSNGNTYSGGLDIRYQFNNGKWDYRVKKQGSNDYLTLTGDGVNITRTTPDGFPVYDIDYEEGTTFQSSFQSEYGGTPPTPSPAPVPVSNFQTNTNEYKILFQDSSGNIYTGGIDVRYQYNNGKWNYRAKKTGTNEYLTLTGDGVNVVRTTPDGFPVYGLDYEDGESFQDTFQSAYGGQPPTPTPLPPSQLKKIQINLTKGQTAIQAYNWDGTKSTPAESFTIHLEEQPDGSYQVYVTGGSTDPNHNVGGHLWVNLSYTGLRLNRLSNGNWEIPADIITKRLPAGATAKNIKDWFMNAYYKPPDPTPDPTPPSGPQIVGTIDAEDFVGLIFSNSSSALYEGNVTAKWLGDTDGDGKNELIFEDENGNELQLSVAQGYEADVPEPDKQASRARRLQSDDDDAWTYETTESLDRFREEFMAGFDVRHDAPIIPVGDDGYTVQGFILYNDTMETFGIDEPSYQPDITQSAILGFCNWQGDYQKDEKTRKAKLFGFAEPDDDDDDMFGSASTGATPTPTPPSPSRPPPEEEGLFSGTFFNEGGEDVRREPELFASPPSSYCDIGSGRGRRLQACPPNEEGAPPSNIRTEQREAVTKDIPDPTGADRTGADADANKVSRMDLLNLEYNRAHEDDPKHGFFDGEGDAEHTIEYDTVKQTTDERELVSMYATFSDASYVDDKKRPNSLFGMNYKPEESSNNFALYTAPANREAVISIRGTKVSNITDLMSDALILTGYQDTMSVRFNEDLRKVKALMDKYPDAQFTLSGHSLSGAINSYIINELKGTKYEDRIKAVSFNSGRAPNTKSERSEEIKELITDASIVKALKTGDPRYLPIMSSIQRTLNINASDLAGGNLGTLSESQLAQYPSLSRSYQEMIGSLRGSETLEARQSIAEGWIQSNRSFLEGGVNIRGSITNLVKTKIYLDLAIALFDWSANYSYDQIYKRESDLDTRMKNTVNPYEQMFKDGNNAIFKYNSDPISLHHSLIDNDERNVRTYFQDEERPSLLKEGLVGQLGHGLKSHGISNFMSEKDKARVDHTETTFETFMNILDDNVESMAGVLNGLGRKGKDELEEFLEGIF